MSVNISLEGWELHFNAPIGAPVYKRLHLPSPWVTRWSSNRPPTPGSRLYSSPRYSTMFKSLHNRHDEWTNSSWRRTFNGLVTFKNLSNNEVLPFHINVHTGCSLNIVFFFEDLKIFWTLAFLCFPWCQCVYTHQAGRKPALQQNLQSSEKSQHFKEKIQ